MRKTGKNTKIPKHAKNHEKARKAGQKHRKKSENFSKRQKIAANPPALILEGVGE